MRRLPALCILLLAGCVAQIPRVTHDLPDEAALDEFQFTDRNAWRWSDAGDLPSLELHAGSAYQPPVRSPRSIALLPYEVSDFVFEADLLQTGREYGHRDLCLFFGYQDPSHFYYVHMATSPDQNAHNIFLVDGAPRRPLLPVQEQGVEWGTDDWHAVRLERQGKAIRLSFDGQELFSVEDETFPVGRVGVGSFDDTGRFARIRLCSPQFAGQPRE